MHQFSVVARDIVAKFRNVAINVDKFVSIVVQAIDVLEESIIAI
jgi:hypothetical protein